MSSPTLVDRWQPAPRDVLAALAVILALAAVAAFAIWGMSPSRVTVTPSAAPPAVTTTVPAEPQERESD